MTKGVPKKRQDEQLRKKRLQAPPARAVSAKPPPNKAIPIAQRGSRPSGGASA
jgi:hypothetical protein